VNDSERDVSLHSAALVVAEMVPSFLYPLSLTIADYRGLSLTIAAKRSAVQRSAAVVEIGLYPQRPGSIADQSRSHMDDVGCSADTRLEERREAMAVVSCDGTVLWIPQSIFFSSCPIDITHFPFDVQTCTLEFASWTFDGMQLDLDFFGNLTEVTRRFALRGVSL